MITITKNVGRLDRVIRMIAGAALGSAAWREGGLAGLIMGLAAAVAVLTGLLGWCGFYALLGVKTCRVDKP